MEERSKDLKEIIRSMGKVTPIELGKLYSAYSKKYNMATVYKNAFNSDIFNGRLD